MLKGFLGEFVQHTTFFPYRKINISCSRSFKVGCKWCRGDGFVTWLIRAKQSHPPTRNCLSWTQSQAELMKWNELVIQYSHVSDLPVKSNCPSLPNRKYITLWKRSSQGAFICSSGPFLLFNILQSSISCLLVWSIPFKSSGFYCT